jgi:hypothetical protein
VPKTTSFAGINEKDQEEVDDIIGMMNRRRGSDEDLNQRDAGFDVYSKGVMRTGGD